MVGVATGIPAESFTSRSTACSDWHGAHNSSVRPRIPSSGHSCVSPDRFLLSRFIAVGHRLRSTFSQPGQAVRACSRQGRQGDRCARLFGVDSFRSERFRVSTLLIADEIAGRHHEWVQDKLYELSPGERQDAYRAWRRVPASARREAVRWSRRGQSHPDPTIAAAAERWAQACLRRIWWNRVPAWLLASVGAAEALIGWIVAGWRLGLGGVVVVIIGLMAWNIRQAANQVMRASRTQTSGEPGR